VIGRHVAIGAGAAVAVQPTQAAIQKRQPSPEDRRAGLTSAIGDPLQRSRARLLLLGTAGRKIGAGSDHEGGNEGKAAEDQEESSPPVNGSHHCISPSQAFLRAQNFLQCL
jgi:hypothetical protein